MMHYGGGLLSVRYAAMAAVGDRRKELDLYEHSRVMHAHLVGGDGEEVPA